MLLITAELNLSCQSETNLAEMVQDGWHKVVKITGETREPTMVFKYLVGAPFSGYENIRAPIALKKRDVITIDANTGTIQKVEREKPNDEFGYDVVFDIKDRTEKATAKK